MKLGHAVVVAISLVGVALAGSAAAQTSLLVSGQTNLAIIDTGSPAGPDNGDCRFTATLSSIMSGPPITSTMLISTAQSNSPLLRVCNGLSFDATGMKVADSSSNYVSANITNAHGPMGFNFPNALPLYAELVDETPDPNINTPVRMNDGLDGGEVIDSAAAAAVFGRMCTVSAGAGGPAALIRGSATPTLLVDLPLYPNTSNPTYVKLPGPPAMFELAAGGFQAFDAYVPVTADKHITVASTDAPGTLLVDIALDALPGCSSAAPTMSGFAIVAVALAMLTAGAVSLSRRDGFRRALSF